MSPGGLLSTSASIVQISLYLVMTVVGLLFVFDGPIHRRFHPDSPLLPVVALSVGGVIVFILGFGGLGGVIGVSPPIEDVLERSVSSYPLGVVVSVIPLLALALLVLVFPAQIYLGIGTSPSLSALLSRFRSNRDP